MVAAGTARWGGASAASGNWHIWLGGGVGAAGGPCVEGAGLGAAVPCCRAASYRLRQHPSAFSKKPSHSSWPLKSQGGCWLSGGYRLVNGVFGGTPLLQANSISPAEDRGPWPGLTWAQGLDLHTGRFGTALSPWRAFCERGARWTVAQWPGVGAPPPTDLALKSPCPCHILCHSLAPGGPKEPLLPPKLHPDPSLACRWQQFWGWGEVGDENLRKHSWSPGWEGPQRPLSAF